MIDMSKLKRKLRENSALYGNDKVITGVIERIEPKYADEWPVTLETSILDALRRSGIHRPYQHQVDAINLSLKGTDVVMESPTASGKTLAFIVPMLDSIVRKAGSHALMIYPMKALAFDQRFQIERLCKSLSIESWTYDGDTPNEHKKLLRQNPPQILFTNPEYLNTSFLAWRQKWSQFLRNLRYVIIDEMHEYRGFFGGNMALLLRRFFLQMNRLDVSPRVFLSTATCANPEQHARDLTGRDVELVSAKEALRPRRNFIFVDPDIPDFKYRDILRIRVEKAALTVLSMGLQVLIFCPTKRFLEEAYRGCRHDAVELGLDSNKISVFHADLKNDLRQSIQWKMKSGDISVLFTTNALELGLDIGGLDGVILAGFPPSIMSAWQQIGRAGRGWQKDAFVLFFAMNDPIDRFFVGNLDAFLRKPYDQLVIDPSNQQLIENHLPSLVEETGGKIRPRDKEIIGDVFYRAAAADKGRPIKGYQPQHHLSIRGGIGQSFQLKSGNEELGKISAMRRFREAYIGAIFTFFGRRYAVRSHEEYSIILEPVELGRRTEPKFYSVLSLSRIIDGFGYGDVEVYYGLISIVMNFSGYNLVDEKSGEILSAGGTEDAIFMRDHHAFWIRFSPSEKTRLAIGALEHLVRVGAMFVIPADRFDTSTYSKTNESGAEAFYYENYSGGIGVAKSLFNVWVVALKKGMEIAKNCPCKIGCQNCIEPAKSYDISNAQIDKIRGIELASDLLAAVEKGPDRKFQNGRMIPQND